VYIFVGIHYLVYSLFHLVYCFDFGMSIFLHINCEHRIEIYFMQHILYIVPCTKKVFSLFTFKIMTYTLIGLLVTSE
jgi:hypothetical protein